jgi:hypothetical protein
MNSEAVPKERPVRAFVARHLGAEPSELSVVSEELPVYDRLSS